jgi:hypothetical protein
MLSQGLFHLRQNAFTVSCFKRYEGAISTKSM